MYTHRPGWLSRNPAHLYDSLRGGGHGVGLGFWVGVGEWCTFPEGTSLRPAYQLGTLNPKHAVPSGNPAETWSKTFLKSDHEDVVGLASPNANMG